MPTPEDWDLVADLMADVLRSFGDVGKMVEAAQVYNFLDGDADRLRRFFEYHMNRTNAMP